MSFGQNPQGAVSLRDAINRLFEDSFVTSESPSGGAQPVPVNVFHAGDNIVVYAPMPGLQPEDLDINVTNGVLSIRGEQRGPGQERRDFLRHEWTVGPYQRSIPLPDYVDVSSARASLDNGVLVVTFNRSEQSKPRKIQIQTG